MVQLSKRSRGRSTSCCGGLQGLLSPRLFKALSDPRRLSLFVRLAEAAQPCTVGLLARGSGVDLSVVSRHLALLREAGIIRCERRGKEVWCAVDADAAVKILRDLADALEACCPNGARAATLASRAPGGRLAPRRGRPVS